ncbi:MAG: DUF3108 domain-containing protein [Nitrospirae bacterium]|jgi:hypothetical protein|nr:DUF3108 domain-containing protein [Nitrospirota bacterium]
MKNYDSQFKNVFSLNFAFLIFNFAFFVASSYAGSFNIPEKFEYDLKWAGIKAGTASLEIINDGDNLKIISTARSADWLSVFYTVDDRIESTLFTGKPSNYRVKIREGRHRRDKEIIFDHDENKAKYIDHLENKIKDFDIPDFIFDPLSSFYYVRTLSLTVGESVFVAIFDSKNVWNVEVQVLRREKITLPTGTFNTIVIKPIMESEGIFYRKGDIFIWLTDDIKRIPVKLQTKVAVGHITATLVDGSY